MTTASERFLRYVAFETTSDEFSETCPSSAKQKLLVSCALKDVFCDLSGEKLAADRKAMTYTFLYRDAKKTLTAAEVDAAHKTVLDALAAKVKELKFR